MNDHARRSDPVTSHRKVRDLKRDLTFKAKVVRAAAQLGVFTDTQLRDQLELIHDQRFERNIVAKVRGTIEKEGLIHRVPLDDVEQRELVFRWGRMRP